MTECSPCTHAGRLHAMMMVQQPGGAGRHCCRSLHAHTHPVTARAGGEWSPADTPLTRCTHAGRQNNQPPAGDPCPGKWWHSMAGVHSSEDDGTDGHLQHTAFCTRTSHVMLWQVWTGIILQLCVCRQTCHNSAFCAMIQWIHHLITQQHSIDVLCYNEWSTCIQYPLILLIMHNKTLSLK